MPDPFSAVITEQCNTTFQCTHCAKQKHHGFQPLLKITWMDIFVYPQCRCKEKLVCSILPGILSWQNILPIYSWQNFGCELQSRYLPVTGTRVLSFIFMESKIRPRLGQNQIGLQNICQFSCLDYNDLSWNSRDLRDQCHLNVSCLVLLSISKHTTNCHRC